MPAVPARPPCGAGRPASAVRIFGNGALRQPLPRVRFLTRPPGRSDSRKTALRPIPPLNRLLEKRPRSLRIGVGSPGSFERRRLPPCGFRQPILRTTGTPKIATQPGTGLAAWPKLPERVRINPFLAVRAQCGAPGPGTAPCGNRYRQWRTSSAPGLCRSPSETLRFHSGFPPPTSARIRSLRLGPV